MVGPIARTGLGIALVMAGLSGTATLPAVASAAPPSKPALLNCAGLRAVRPSKFVISCADGNAMLTKTHWVSWAANGAEGKTDFGLNLCNPYCAASKMSFFASSGVRLSLPVNTPKHGRLFEKMVITYHLKGKTRQFVMSWRGDPQF